MKTLQPDHNTISNLRRDNSKCIKLVFRKTVEITKDFNLIGSRLIAGDSTKLRAQNSKKNGSIVQRSEYVKYIVENKDWIVGTKNIIDDDKQL